MDGQKLANYENNYDPNKHHRRSIRLKGDDYSQAGLYFITFCVQHRVCLFGHIADGTMQLNEAGRMVEKEWLALSHRFLDIALHEYVVMPNHFHAIVQIVGSTTRVDPSLDPANEQKDPPNEIGQPRGIAPPGLPDDDSPDETKRKSTLGIFWGR